jgi:hypothetical protein
MAAVVFAFRGNMPASEQRVQLVASHRLSLPKPALGPMCMSAPLPMSAVLLTLCLSEWLCLCLRMYLCAVSAHLPVRCLQRSAFAPCKSESLNTVTVYPRFI